MTGEKSKNKIQKNFRFSIETTKKLEDYAELTGEDMTAIVERAIAKHLDSVAMDVADEHEARVKRIRSAIKSSNRISSVTELSKKPVSISSASTGRTLTKYTPKGKADDSTD